MKSPLNISETVKRYGLDEDMSQKQQLIAFDSFIWQDCQISTVDELVSFEKKYQKYSEKFEFCFDSEVGEFSPVYMCDGNLDLLCKGAFQRTAKNREKDSLYLKFIEAGLNDLEAVVIITFLAEISGIYRKDSYQFGVPPFIESVCRILNNAISKLPVYTKIVVRACNEYDRADFKIGDIFRPGFCLTTSADQTWKDVSENRYSIKPLDSTHTKARNLFNIRDILEMQVTFLQDAQFLVTGVSDWGDGKKQFEMEETQ